MAVYLDDAEILWRGKRWCHLYADSLDELEKFAGSIGLHRDWLQQRGFPHYDVTGMMIRRAKAAGAIQVPAADENYIRLRRLHVRGEYR
jgi:hypothetical protein